MSSSLAARARILRTAIFGTEEAMKVGFIGLGTMGQHMAMNLLRGGHTLTVHDLRRDAAGPHIAEGAVWADTPGAAAAGAEAVFTSLPGPVEVEAVALGA